MTKGKKNSTMVSNFLGNLYLCLHHHQPEELGEGIIWPYIYQGRLNIWASNVVTVEGFC